MFHSQPSKAPIKLLMPRVVWAWTDCIYWYLVASNVKDKQYEVYGIWAVRDQPRHPHNVWGINIKRPATDQTAWICRLISVFSRCICHKAHFHMNHLTCSVNSLSSLNSLNLRSHTASPLYNEYCSLTGTFIRHFQFYKSTFQNSKVSLEAKSLRISTLINKVTWNRVVNFCIFLVWLREDWLSSLCHSLLNKAIQRIIIIVINYSYHYSCW